MALEHLKSLRVSVGVPSNGMWLTDFAISFIGMVQAFSEYRVGTYKNQELKVISTKGSILPKSRFLIIQEALAQKATHVLFVDSDHVFPSHMLHQLIMADKDVIGLNCQTKTIPPAPTARYKPVEGDPPHGQPVYSYPSAPKLEQVWRLGCGIMLINTKVFNTVDYRHAFDMHWRDDVENFQGEDWTLCEAFEKAGVEIWVDHELSMQTAHMGYFDYRHDLVPGALELEWQAEQKRKNKPLIEVAA